MADSILRLKVESQEYDNKLKQATQGLTRYADECRKVGGTLEVVEKETLDYVRALGQMDTTSRTATGKLAEMKKTFTELSVVYKNMTDEEKKSPFGQALAASLDQLKGRCAGIKKELDDVGKELNDTGGFMDALTSKLTVNIDAFKLLEMGLKVTKGAFEMYKSVIESTEGTADQYAIVQEQLNASVDSFFRNINEGSFASFLQGLSDVTSRAKEAYQAMDELSSFAVRYNPKNQADMQKIDKLLKESRALMAKGDKEGAAAKTAEATRIANQAKVNTLAYGEKEYNAGVKTLRSLLGGTGVTYTNKQLEYYSDPANWNKIKTAADEYGTTLDNLTKAEKDLANAGRTGNRKLIKSYNERYQSAKNAFDAQSESNKRAYNYLNTRDTTGTKQGEAFARATQQIYGKQMAEYAADSIQARIDRANAVATKPTGSGNGTAAKEVTSMLKVDELGNITISTTESMKQLQAQLRDYQQKLSTATNAFDQYSAQQGIEQTQKNIAAQPMALSLGWDTESVVQLQDNLDTLLEDMRSKIKANPLKVEVDTKGGGLEELDNDAKVNMKAWGAAASAVQNLGNALQSLEDPSAKIAGIVGQAVANIALGFAQATASPATGAAGVFGWIAAATAGLATMVATITQIKSVTKGGFAEGGIVPGNSFSGDNLHINDYGINSGELILNRSQQNNIAAQLQGNNLENLSLTSRISGRDLIIAINANQTSINGGKLSFTS